MASADFDRDGNGDLAVAAASSDSVSVLMGVTNTNPVAVADARTVVEDSGATSFDVLANDSDAEGDPIQITAVTDPPHGSAAVVQGSPDVVSYTPDPD